MAIIVTKKQIITAIMLANLSCAIIGVSLAMLVNSQADSLSELRESVASGNVYVDSQSIIYKCEIK